MSDPEEPGRYEIVIPGPVSRAIREELPEAVAWAVIEFVSGPLLENPYRIGTEPSRAPPLCQDQVRHQGQPLLVELA